MSSTALPPVGQTYRSEDRLERWSPSTEGVWVEGRKADGSCLLACKFNSPGLNHMHLSREQAEFLATELLREAAA